MREAIQKLKKHGIRIWLLSVIIASSAFISYGAYTGLKSVKRVVTTQASPGELFSSNCMRTALVNKRINTREYTATVCNYVQRNPAETNPADITYTLTAELKVLYNNNYYTMAELRDLLGENSDVYTGYVQKIAGRTYSIVKTEDDTDGVLPAAAIELNSTNNYRTVYNTQTLSSGKASTDKYKVVFDSAELEDAIPDIYVYLKTQASPNLATIEGLLCAALNASDVASWQGAFVEADCDSVDYDFYNYVISGSGVGTVDIMWDPEWFEPNLFFFSAMSENTITAAQTISDPTSQYNQWKKATLTVDSTSKNRYEMQLYKLKSDTSYTGDHVATNYITCIFTPASE